VSEVPRRVELIEVDADGQELLRLVVELVKDGDRRFRVVPLVESDGDTWLTARQAAASLKMMGLDRRWDWVYRLAVEGKVRVRYPLPHTVEFSLASLKEFAKRVNTDPEFWS